MAKTFDELVKRTTTKQTRRHAARRTRELLAATADEQEDFDGRFTPEVVAHLDRISGEMKAGKSVSIEEVDKHLADVRETWLKDRAG
jgi:hypothetical protein